MTHNMLQAFYRKQLNDELKASYNANIIGKNQK